MGRFISLEWRYIIVFWFLTILILFIYLVLELTYRINPIYRARYFSWVDRTLQRAVEWRDRVLKPLEDKMNLFDTLKKEYEKTNQK